MGNEFFNKVQYGTENPAARGTPVDATRLWIGQMQAIKTDRKIKYPKEAFGVRAESFRGLVGQYLYQNSLVADDGCFQHLPLLFGCGVKGAVVPVEATSGQLDYPWDFSPSLTGANNPDAFSVRMGDDAQAWIAEYCMIESIRISGSVGQGQEISPVKLEGSFFGRQIATTTFTAGQSAPSLEPLNAKLAQLFMDASFAALPTRQVETATVLGSITPTTGGGYAKVTVTALGMTGTPKEIHVDVLESDSAIVVAGKIRVGLAADSAVTAKFIVGGSGATISLTKKIIAADDATLNIAIDNGTCTGLTAAGTSANTTGGSVGTELANLVRAFDLQILTGVHPRFEGSTAKTFNAHAEGILAAIGTFTIEGGSSAVALLAAQQAQTFKAFQLRINGPQIGTGMSHELTLDFGGTVEDATPISGAERGDNQATFVVHGIYDATGAKTIVPKVVTNIALY